jgi:hypothetical protein
MILISDDPGAAKVTTSIFSFLENSYQRALPLYLSIFTHNALPGVANLWMLRALSRPRERRLACWKLLIVWWAGGLLSSGGTRKM